MKLSRVPKLLPRDLLQLPDNTHPLTYAVLIVPQFSVHDDRVQILRPRYLCVAQDTPPPCRGRLTVGLLPFISFICNFLNICYLQFSTLHKTT
jgi:hypothetical protein